METTPSLLGRGWAPIQGEVLAETLKPYRAAGLTIRELLTEIEERRFDLKVSNIHPCTVDAHSQLYFLCAWNAYISMPKLLTDKPKPQQKPPVKFKRKNTALPGTTGFDPWMLTDRLAFARFKADPKAIEAVECVWQMDPNPHQTLEVWDEIQSAMLVGDVALANVGYYYCMPWGSIFEVRRQVNIHGKSMRVGQQFTLHISAEEMLEGGGKETFIREIVIGNFKPTREIGITPIKRTLQLSRFETMEESWQTIKVTNQGSKGKL